MNNQTALLVIDVQHAFTHKSWGERNNHQVDDATAAFGLKDHHNRYYDPEIVHQLSVATLHDEFATIVTTSEMLAW
ncbi:hypothetical protein [Priestia koreensis]|uniref:Isochorismatase family protein n=1 Tax=Priestia koreensis TaxID=284581 RepID=A0A0M0KZS4_9BACI|nr:hypothetical protein [Priestia koreensis]KOO44316.1 hypothetical protein AMD01_13630 [Priestia koreensis]MCM3005210.1 hypothetical protein [Priestia koreensis]